MSKDKEKPKEKNTEKRNKKEGDFDHLLKKVLKVPPPKRDKKNEH